MGRIVGMIANQRSGTHLLRGCFNSHPDVFCPPEPMYRSAPGTEDELARVLRGYEGEERVVVLDVKYNQITPPVEEFLRGVRVLHLVRKDIKRMYFSQMLRVFYHHHATEEEVRQVREHGKFVRLRVSELEFEAYRKRVERFQELFSPLADLVVFYESLTDNREVKVLPDPWSGVLCAFLGVREQTLLTRGGKEAPANVEDHMWIGQLPYGVTMERWE